MVGCASAAANRAEKSNLTGGSARQRVIGRFVLLPKDLVTEPAKPCNLNFARQDEVNRVARRIDIRGRFTC